MAARLGDWEVGKRCLQSDPSRRTGTAVQSLQHCSPSTQMGPQYSRRSVCQRSKIHPGCPCMRCPPSLGQAGMPAVEALGVAEVSWVAVV